MLCAICSGLMSEAVRMYHPTLECFLATCQTCGTGRSLFPNGYGPDYYAGDYYAYATRRPRWKRWLKTALWRIPGAGRWFPVIPPKTSGKVLDIGCGHGLFLDLLKSIGWDTYGLEISPKAVEFCQPRHRVSLAREAKFPNGSLTGSQWTTYLNTSPSHTN